MHLSCSVFLKVADFNVYHLHLSPTFGETLIEFSRDLWHQKTRWLGYHTALFARS